MSARRAEEFDVSTCLHLPSGCSDQLRGNEKFVVPYAANITGQTLGLCNWVKMTVNI